MTNEKLPKKPSNLPLIAMIMVYMLGAAGAFGNFFIGLMFGSEIYREQGIPLAEWALIAGPLLVTIGMLAATIVLWNKGHRRITYVMFAAMLVAVAIYANSIGFLFL